MSDDGVRGVRGLLYSRLGHTRQRAAVGAAHEGRVAGDKHLGVIRNRHIGLDDGPVFEKQIRSTRIGVAPGVRLVLTNDAGHRHDGLRALVQEHSPKNTAAFMNMVLGTVESEAGSEGLREEIALVTAKRW